MNDKQLLRDFTAHFEAADKYTFTLTTTRPYAPALDEIGNPSYSIIPHEAIEKWGDLSQHPVGCGAFVLDAYVKSERLKVVKNAEFYMPGRPFLDSIEWVIMTDEAALFQAFRTKRHDYCGASLDKLKVEELSGIKHVVARKSPNYWNRCLLLRVDREPFDDERLCKAVDLAVDRQDLIDKAAFGEGFFNGPVSPSLEYWSLPQDEVRDFYKVDLTEAKRLVEAAGYGDGIEVDAPVMNVQGLTKDAAIVKEHLAKIGDHSEHPAERHRSVAGAIPLPRQLPDTLVLQPALRRAGPPDVPVVQQGHCRRQLHRLQQRRDGRLGVEGTLGVRPAETAGDRPRCTAGDDGAARAADQHLLAAGLDSGLGLVPFAHA